VSETCQVTLTNVTNVTTLRCCALTAQWWSVGWTAAGAVPTHNAHVCRAQQAVGWGSVSQLLRWKQDWLMVVVII
jgi:hypothetical protein